jgi:hypothetical protein
MITFVRDIAAWVVVDYVISANGIHNYTQIWKFAEPVPQTKGATQSEGFYKDQIVLPTSGGSDVKRLYSHDTTASSVNLSIYQTGLQPLNYSSYYGTDTGALYGFIGTGSGDPRFSPDVHVDWSGTGNQVVISVLLPFQGSGADGVSQSINTAANGTAGLDLVINGKALSIRANTSGATLNLAALTVTETDTGGANPRTLTIGDSAVATASSINDNSGVTPISIPTGFHWNTDAAGTKTAIYRP